MEQDDELDVLVAGEASSDWIDVRVRMSLEAAPTSESVANALTIAMRERMGDRRLPAGELTKVAKELLELLLPRKS